MYLYDCQAIICKFLSIYKLCFFTSKYYIAEKTHDNGRVDDAVAEQGAVGGDGVETLQQQYQRFDQHQVQTVQRKDTGGEMFPQIFARLGDFFRALMSSHDISTTKRRLHHQELM